MTLRTPLLQTRQPESTPTFVARTKQKGLRLGTRKRMHPAGALSKAPSRFDTSSGYRISRTAAPSRRGPPRQWLVSHLAAFVPGYSGGPATDSHRVPFVESIGARILYGSPVAVNYVKPHRANARPTGASARRHKKIVADAVAKLVNAIHEIDQIGVQPLRQNVVDPGVMDLRMEHAGQALGFRRLRVADIV